MKSAAFNITFGAIFLYLFFFTSRVYAFYSHMPATRLLGQPDFLSSTLHVSSSSVTSPQDVIEIQGKLIAIDQANRHRILIWNTIPTANNQPADVVIGQPNFLTSSGNYGGISARSLSNPTSLATDGTKLFVTDRNNSRILVWNTVPTQNYTAADFVIGQPNFTSSQANQGNVQPLAYTLNRPEAVLVSGDKLFIADSNNNRVLIFNSIPNQVNSPADVVLGQPDFTSNSVNNGGVSASSLSYPQQLAADHSHLIVSDNLNERVLIWNTIPSANNQPANVVVGQQDFTSNQVNQGGSPTASTINSPTGVSIHDGRLIVADRSNHRVLIYNAIPQQNNTSANIVLGQPNFTSDTPNNGGQSALTLRGPTNAIVIKNSLYITEEENYRITVFENSLPDLVLSRKITGQPDGRLRFSGIAQTNIANQTIKQIEYSVNGGSWTGGFATDEKFDSSHEDYYFDFDPSSNTMANNQGFTVKIRATHNNDKDVGSSTLYFEPFQSLSPVYNTFSLNRTPTFVFVVQKVRFQDLKENLDRFRIAISTDGVHFIPHIDYIPVDYNSVRLHPDNFKPNTIATNSGTWEDKDKVVTYEQDNSVISAQSKEKLSDGTYYWRVEAIDRAGQVQYTEPKILRIGSRQVVTSRPFFPLTVTGIGGINGNVHLSTENSSSPSQPYIVSTRWPTFAGIATAESTVTFSFRNTSCTVNDDPFCTKTHSTVVQDNSTFRTTLPQALQIGQTYEVTGSVKDSGDNYNELPLFLLAIQTNQ